MSVPFLTDQRLSQLDLGHPPLTHLDVAAAEKRRDRGGFQPEGEDSPWKNLPRADWQTRLITDLRRVVLLGDAGLGKTSNAEWMAGTLARVHRGLVPFLLPIEKLPESADDTVVFGALLARWRLAEGCSETDFPWKKAKRMLLTLRQSGRLVLVLDSLDQALSRPKAVATLKHLMTAGDWKRCPLVVTTRPHALSSQWDAVFKDVASDFRFVRVEEMDAKKQRHLLGTVPSENSGVVWRYDLIPDEGRRLLGVPRLIELIRGLGNDHSAYANLKTMTDVYWKCVNEMLLDGLKADAAAERLIGSDVTRHSALQKKSAAAFARTLLGAVAFEMFCDASGTPNVSHVPSAAVGSFLSDVQNRMEQARVDHEHGRRFTHAKAVTTGDEMGFLGRVDAVGAMNAGPLENYLVEADRTSDLKFRNPTMQAFFAAVWVCQHGTPNDIERLKDWVEQPNYSSIIFDRPFAEFWRFVSELGGTGAWDASAVRAGCWEEVIGVVYRHKVRVCEIIWRSWKRMTELKAKARTDFLAEFPAIRRGEYGEGKKRIADDMMVGFINLAHPESMRPGDTGECWIGVTRSLEDMPPGSYDPSDPPPVDPNAKQFRFPPQKVRLPPFAIQKRTVCEEVKCAPEARPVGDGFIVRSARRPAPPATAARTRPGSGSRARSGSACGCTRRPGTDPTGGGRRPRRRTR